MPYGFQPRLRVVYFSTRYLHSTTDAARVTELHTEMFQLEYFGAKRSKVKITRHKNQVRIGRQTERNIAACWVGKLRWIFPAAMPAA